MTTEKQVPPTNLHHSRSGQKAGSTAIGLYLGLTLSLPTVKCTKGFCTHFCSDSGINLFFCSEAIQKRELNQKPSDSIVQDVDLHFFFPQT